MEKKIYLLISLIFLQIVVIGFLSYKIYQNKKNVLGKVSVNTVSRESINFFPTDNFKGFFEPKPNTTEEIHRDWLSYVPKYTINTDALNERYDYLIKKDGDVYRIIALGDSYTFGVNISTEKNWTELLEDYLNKNKLCPKINKYEVINLGVGGYDTAYEIERFKLRGIKYNPDLIVWYVTDLYRITDKIQQLAEKMDIDETKNQSQGVFYEAWREAREIIMKQYGERGLIDYQLSLLKKFRQKDYPNKPLLFLSAWDELKRLGTNNIYYSNTFVFNDKKYLIHDNHFNDLGHEKFMEELVAALEKNKLLPCN